MAPETEDDVELLRDAAREVEARLAPKVSSRVRFGAKASGLHDDKLSTRPAPGPQGPPTDQLLADAKRRRRERAEEEHVRRG